VSRRRRSVDEVDLHGLGHEEAAAVVHRFLNDHWAPRWRLRIVVGRRGRMRDMVARVVCGYGLEAREDPWNEGVLLVDVD
jgi:DNA-nicking Smr family endonuclease